MATIADIAKRANVSKTLVSRVLNDRKGVSPEAKERILEAIKELNYRKNELASSLVLQKTQTIGIILDSLCTDFFFDLINGFEAGGEEKGYNILFCDAKNDLAAKRRYVDFFSHGRADGIIIYGSFISDETLIRDLSETGFPFVLIENEMHDLNINNVLVDNLGGAYKATEHLIKLNYRDIIHFTGDMNVKVSLDRLNGYVKAMQDYNIPIKDDSIIYADFTERSGYEKMKQILDRGKRPRAIFFGADMTAFGAIRAIYESGLNIPNDIAIVGFDDDKPESRDILFPPLTTIKQPLKEMGYTSMKILIDNINTPNWEPQKILFKTELIVRESCGAKK